ncbi:MAG: tripartite tricarboxylate transporter TctB family protein [Deltaproteobacteria bacterium]|nr:tripartite tricarboxylate transporter TctB family protein [Deltaproteobacteria bacterium]
MKEKLKLLDVQLKLALMIIFGFFYFYAIPFPEKSRSFPQLIAVVSMIIVLVSLFFDFTKQEIVHGEIIDVDDAEVTVLDEETKKARKQRFYKAWAIIIVSSAVGFLGGFLFSTLFFFLGFTIFFGERKDLVKNTCIALAMTAVVYVIFEIIMGVPLLDGILW